jgi:hypothetical protein
MQAGAKAPGCEATAAAPIHDNEVAAQGNEREALVSRSQHHRGVGAEGADRETMSPNGYPLPRRSKPSHITSSGTPPPPPKMAPATTRA